MSLPQLRNIDFDTPTDLDKSWFAHYQHHLDIVAAIKKQYNQNLIAYQIWPFNKDAVSDILLKHQQYHDDMNSVLNINDGSNLLDVDIKDPKASALWVNLNYFEHSDAAQVLKI